MLYVGWTVETPQIIWCIYKDTKSPFEGRYVFSFVHVCQKVFLHASMHVVAEAGLLGQRALFISHRLLGPNIALEAIALPAEDIFFPISMMANNLNVTHK